MSNELFYAIVGSAGILACVLFIYIRQRAYGFDGLSGIFATALVCFLVGIVLQWTENDRVETWTRERKPIFDVLVSLPFTASCGVSGARDNGTQSNCTDRDNLRLWSVVGSESPTYYVGEIQSDGLVKKTMIFSPDAVTKYGAKAQVWTDESVDWNHYRSIFTK